MATSAWAEWTLISEAENEESTLYLDIETIKSNKDLTYAWILMDLLIPYQGILSSKTYYEVHCGVPQWTKTKAYIRYETQMGKGNIKDTWTIEEEDQEITYPTPGSIKEEMVSTVCALANSD